ncbi:MAG: hypothetical protein ACE5JA_04535 [bacterium]
MCAGRIVGIVVAAIFLFFGVLWLLAATSSSPENVSSGGRFFVGIILMAVGGLLLFAAVKKPGRERELKIVQKVELPGDLRLEQLKCSSCGARLDKDSISVRGGSIIVSCPYCSSVYEIEEEPKW